MAFGRSKDDKRREHEGDEPIGGPGSGGDIFDAAAGIDAAQQEIARLQAERDDLNQKYLRTLADYQNSQRRAVSNEKEAKQQGITSVVLNVLTVLDHFDLALAQDPSKATTESIVSGVKVIRDELMKVLQNHGVRLIEAARNGTFDPSVHQAVMQVDDAEIEPGHVVAMLQPGFTLNDRVVRPATVTVRPGVKAGDVGEDPLKGGG
jgi:molecular chaperone GrpE